MLRAALFLAAADASVCTWELPDIVYEAVCHDPYNEMVGHALARSERMVRKLELRLLGITASSTEAQCNCSKLEERCESETAHCESETAHCESELAHCESELAHYESKTVRCESELAAKCELAAQCDASLVSCERKGAKAALLNTLGVLGALVAWTIVVNRFR
jgi:hypothetical protein